MEDLKRIFSCLVSPRKTFRSILEKPRLLNASILMLIIALIAASANYIYVSKLPLTFIIAEKILQGRVPITLINPEQLRQAMVIMNVILGFTVIFGRWIIGAIIIHIFSKTQKTEGSFTNMLTLAAYSSTPLLLQHILRLIDSFVITEDEVKLIMSPLQVSSQPFLNATANAALDTFNIFTLWSMILLVVAASENYKTSTIKSTIIVVAAYIAIMFLSLILPL